MRNLGTLVTLVAVTVIVGTASFVLSKADQPRLAVSVSGVPGYVYYDRDYDLTLEYANLGAAISGPLELAVQLPETFALAESVGDASRRGERLTWTLDGLGKGESGSIPLTVRGVLPDDLTSAVYDLPGYEGHTAFVEGFELALTLTSSDAMVNTLAVADTGIPVATGTIIIRKDTTPDTDDEFAFTELPDIPECIVGPLFDDGTNVGNEVTCSDVPVNQYAVSEVDPRPEYAFGNVSCETTIPSGDTTSVNLGTRTANIDLDEGETVTCTFFNRYLNSLTVEKVCFPANDPGQFTFQILGSNQQPVHGITDVDCGTEFSIGGFDGDTFTVVETGGTGTNISDYVTTFEGCAQDGTITVGDLDRLTCTVINTRSATGTIVIVKNTVPDSNQSFTFGADPEILSCTVGPLTDDGGASSTETCLNVPVGQYDVSENDPSPDHELTGLSCISSDTGGQDTTSTNESTRTASIDLDANETVTCTFTNEAVSVVPLDPFEKYTDSYDEVLEPGEYFTWYIQVPASQEEWTVTDYLPYGFRLAGPIYAPDGVECDPIGFSGFECTGATDTTAIIEVPVKAPDKCGVYKNRATLTYDLISVTVVGPGEHADDYVKVDDCRRERGPRNPRAGR